MNLYSLCKKIDKCDYPPLPADIYSQEVRARDEGHMTFDLSLYNQLRELVDACIKTNPADRPDIQTVYGIAKDMYERTKGQA